MCRIFGSQQFASLPEAIERRNNGTRNYVLENLLNEVCIKLWYRRHVAHVPQTPRYVKHLHRHRCGLLQNFQMCDQRL